ncbi:hypothetical protein [Halobacillus yeomjeoni]|uniref:Uncharacterized protein n=1 Tax=Halobacillus yeomjeoni TaxID=311194 RepID=A0A931MWB9_9BACI|nr:hypothetical protein [Halobacillus yeomjeoni]MBH0231492.1 hypothetical protein [Halobacillus yeomjeoni]
MSKIYSDCFMDTLLTIPETFIDVKTGESQKVSSKVIEEIEYHSKNNTLQHLLFSALHNYLSRASHNGITNDVLLELLEIKQMLNLGDKKPSVVSVKTNEKPVESKKVDLKEIEDLLEAFGG